MSGCGCGKAPYSSRKRAKRAASDHHSRRRVKLTAYRCPAFEHLWHLTSAPADDRRWHRRGERCV